MLHSYHCHPRISAGMHGPIVGNQRLHVRQGEVDATCGYHCVLMALMVFGQVRRNALIWDTRDARLQALRKVARRSCGMPVQMAVTKPHGWRHGTGMKRCGCLGICRWQM